MTTIQRRFPTGDSTTDSCTEFLAERMERPKLHGSKPCLREDWWVEDMIAAGRRAPLPRLDQEDGLRFVWRRARDDHVARYGGAAIFPIGEPANLLLHQLTELVPTILTAAAEISAAQRQVTAQMEVNNAEH